MIGGDLSVGVVGAVVVPRGGPGAVCVAVRGCYHRCRRVAGGGFGARGSGEDLVDGCRGSVGPVAVVVRYRADGGAPAGSVRVAGVLSSLSATVVDIVGAAPMVGEGWFDRRTAEIAADRG